MPNLSLLIKPVSGACNLRCRYCFYLDESARRQTSCFGTMSEHSPTPTARSALRFRAGNRCLRAKRFIGACWRCRSSTTPVVCP